jgi:hypothetical protein
LPDEGRPVRRRERGMRVIGGIDNRHQVNPV